MWHKDWIFYNMKTFLQKHNWWFYFILTYAISWIIWYLGDLLLPGDLRILALVIGAFGPFCAALWIVKASESKDSLRKWLRSIFNFRIHWSWYVLTAFAFPFLVAGLHHLVYLLLGGKSGIVLSTDWLLYLAYLIPTALLSGGNEEPGWRGYITPVLLSRFGSWSAHIIVGAGWALWHLPLFLMQDWGNENESFLLLVIYCIPLSMIMTWIYYSSRKSVIPVMLFHAGSNVVFRYFPMNTDLFENITDEFTLIKTLIYILAAVILLILTKGRLGIPEKEQHN